MLLRGFASRHRFLLLGLAAASILLLSQGVFASPGSTTLVSVDSAGSQGNEWSEYPDISAYGRYIVFTSYASNLVPGDTNGETDVFVHDRVTGQTTRVSVDSAGNQGNARAGYGTPISADGRYVAFSAGANNLVPGDTNGDMDVFVHDRQTGQTTRVSVDSAGNQGNGLSLEPDMSTDGRYVAFYSEASNLVPGDTNGQPDVFVHDRVTGETTRVSVDSAGNQGNEGSAYPDISADGRYVAIPSGASNLVAGDTNGHGDVFVHDRQTGQTTLVSVDSAGNQGNGQSAEPEISSDSRYVAFSAEASNLVAGDTNGCMDVFVHDRQTGQTERVSVDSVGSQGNQRSERPVISADGRYVAFYSHASNLVLGDTNDYCDVDEDGYLDDNCPDVFVHDRQTGQTTRVSVDSAGNQGNDRSLWPGISGDGRFIVFHSEASNLILGDTNGHPDIFVHDRLAAPVGGIADYPSLSPRPIPESGSWPTAAAIAPVATGFVILAAGAWYARRRWRW